MIQVIVVTIDIRLDASPAKNDPFGSVATIAGTLRAAETQVTGGMGVDTFYIAPSTASPITVSSGSSPASSGDVLNVDPRGGQLSVAGKAQYGGRIHCTTKSATVRFWRESNFGRSGSGAAADCRGHFEKLVSSRGYAA